ncbi:hypothetical protein [Desulfitobacterium hafniense]|uniref:hypothetical protein n=1 Tax=Desulfitobacterium hafniense TaxID=49338 RepID=UPI0012FC118C|nr:hypothetical protein [Desulfitobacterium hafniense]
MADPIFAQLFGTDSDSEENRSNKKAQGALVFFDGYPQENFSIVFDVRTPYFTDYYAKTSLGFGWGEASRLKSK